MERKPATFLQASEIAQRGKWFTQRLNPGSAFRRVRLGAAAGRVRVGLSMVWIPPGQQSFAYHAHQLDEEWIYVIEGRGLALVDGKEFEIGPGDFLGFPVPQVPHLLSNPGTTDLVYLTGGDGTIDM